MIFGAQKGKISYKHYKSLVFMEFLILCLGIKLNRPEKNLKLGIKQQKKDKSSLFDSIFVNFPFDLTDSQKNVLNEILNDMGSNKQMNRLLQGDVGSGKTIIALLAMAVSYDSGYQTALIAPTPKGMKIQAPKAKTRLEQKAEALRLESIADAKVKQDQEPDEQDSESGSDVPEVIETPKV